MRNFFVYRLCSICKKYLWDFFGLQVLFHSWAIFVRNFFGCIPYVIKFCEKFFWKYFLAYKLCCMCEKYLWEFFFLAYKFCSIQEKFFGCVSWVRKFCEKFSWLTGCVLCVKKIYEIFFFDLQVLFHSWEIFVRNIFCCLPCQFGLLVRNL